MMPRVLLLAAAVAAAAAAAEVGDSPDPLNASDLCASLWSDSLPVSKPSFAREGSVSCVFIGEGRDGTSVAVEVSKQKGMASLFAFKRECGNMQLLRLEACKVGQGTLELHEAYLPTCLGTGEANGMPFLVMHKPPLHRIEEVDDEVIPSPPQRKALFGQLISAVFALHSIGMSHNNLHGKNIVFDTTPEPHLALINFADVAPLASARLDSYKRDGNAIWRWTAVLANCEPSARWEESLQGLAFHEALDAFEVCLSSTWHAPESLLSAMRILAWADVRRLPEQRVEPVYRTDFVGSVRGPLERSFPWEGTSGCQDWNASQWEAAESEVRFGGYAKCDSVPTFQEERAQACVHDPSHTACFSLRPGVDWSCGSGLKPDVPCTTVGLPADADGRTYDGACLMPDHPSYAYALQWPQRDDDWDLRLALLKVMVVVGALAINCLLLRDIVKLHASVRTLQPQGPEAVEMNERL